jgi:hypothetical protein
MTPSKHTRSRRRAAAAAARIRRPMGVVDSLLQGSELAVSFSNIRESHGRSPQGTFDGDLLAGKSQSLFGSIGHTEKHDHRGGPKFSDSLSLSRVWTR